MIIDAKQSNVVTYGDIKEFKTGIDPKNLEFITTLLSSNLYSAPEQSFIREIVSNAWDSHVEAGNTDTPVIVQYKEDSYSHSVTVRDYGTGLSPERFKEVYCNIGSSTKRDSNEFIGGFGIGKYSSLSCSNTVYITSYYEGTAYFYVMVKSGNAITTNLLMEKPTSEKNGVEVTIKNIRVITPYIKALDFIVFFPNVFFDGDGSDFNDVKLKRFNHFAAASINVSHKLLLGNVLYPCQSSHLSQESRQFLKTIKYTGIVVKFDVGEINITPNRENIIYTSDTIEKINNRIAEAKAEIESIINNKVERDYDNLEEYYKATSKRIYYDPIKDTISNTSYLGYKVEDSELQKFNITYKGINLKDESLALSRIYSRTVPMFKGVVYNDKIYTQKLPYIVQHCQRLDYQYIVICNENTRLLAPIKIFLKENYPNYCIMQNIEYSDFAADIHENVFRILPSKHEELILRGAYDALYAKAKQVDFTTDKDYLELKASLSASRVPKALDIGEIILYVWDPRGWKNKETFKSLSSAVKYLKSFKKGILLANMDSGDSLCFDIANIRGLVYIKARKEVVKSLRELGLSCIVDLDWVTKKDKSLVIAATVDKYLLSDVSDDDVRNVGRTIPKELRKEFERIFKIKDTACRCYSYRGLFLNVTKYDEYTKYLCEQLSDIIKKYREANSLVSLMDSGLSQTLTAAVLMKQKKYRISAEAYKRVRNNKLIKVLCRK